MLPAPFVTPTRIPSSFALAALLAIAAPLPAQCANTWASFGTLPGVNAVVNAVTTWDPDGPGPLPPRVAVGGPFSMAGNRAANVVAAWDPATGQWSAVGAGPTGLLQVNALLALPNGELIAGGGSPLVGATTPTLARWDGTTWIPFGGLTPSDRGVAALVRLPSGDIAVGGHFTAAGAMALPYVGVWNGTSWSSLAGGMDGPVLALTVMPNGDLVAVGAFTTAGGVPASGVARWNGTAWSALGTGLAGNVSGYGPQGQAAVVLPNGDLVVGGSFTHAGGVGAPNLAVWDGVTWNAFGGGIRGSGYSSIGVRGLALLPNGDLVAGGFFMAAGGVPISNLAQWTAAGWVPLGTGLPEGAVTALAVLPNGDLIAGGSFSVAGDIGASRVARWDGTQWASLGGGTAPSDDVRALRTMPDGSVVAGGMFRAAGGAAAFGIAQWDGVAWSALGSAYALRGSVNALAPRPNGDLVAAGFGFVSQWDGTAWTHLPATMVAAVPHADGVEAVAVLANGDLVIGGDFANLDFTGIRGLARWNGSAWTTLGGEQAGEIHAIATLDNGDLVVGGDSWWLPRSAQGVARWNGTAWSSVGAGLRGAIDSEVFALAPLPNGGFVAGGTFTSAGSLSTNNIARWDGTAWSPLGTGTNGTVRRLHVLPNGDILAAGYFTEAGGVAAPGIARWNGTAWSALGAGVPQWYPGVLAIAALPDGDLLVGGGFDGAGGLASPHLVRLTTTCPATVQSTGAGCAGDTVTATLPWIGTSWRAHASGLPSSSLVLVALGFTPLALPLSAVFPTALPGCTLHVSPDVLAWATGANGTAEFQLAIPNTPALAGAGFQQQMVVLALDGTLAVTATNALRMRIGSF